MQLLQRHRLDASHVADEFLESYVCWREACEDVRKAYARWGSSSQRHRALAFESYRASLDREDHAARLHSEWAEQARALKR